MGTVKASIVVVSALFALGGGAVLLRDVAPENITDLVGTTEPLPSSAPVVPETTETVETGTSDENAVPTEQTAEAPAASEPSEEPIRPAIDIVRLESDGAALVSGTGPPGSEISVLIDGDTVWNGPAGDTGAFVAFVDLPHSDTARMMWLASIGPDGETVQSDGSVVLAPSTGAGTARDAARADTHTADGETETEAESLSGLETLTAGGPPTSPATSGPDEETTAAAAQLPAEPAIPEAVAETPGPSAPVAVPALRNDSAGVRPLVPEPLAPEAGLAVDTVRYGEEGEVILSGRAAAPDSDLSVFLDGREAARARTADDGAWQAVLPDVPSGTYNLRADVTDASGRVAARMDLPFRREAPEVIRAARIAAVEADQSAALITVQPGFSLWAIARDRYGDGLQYVAVYNANSGQIDNPDLIYPGQVLTLPASTEVPADQATSQ